MSDFSFQANTLPDFINEPIKYLSVIANTNTAHQTLQSLLAQSHVYLGTVGAGIHELIDGVKSSGSNYYGLQVSRDKNTLRFDSRTPESVSISLDDFTYSHHSYAGRYLQFKKSIPKKGSKEFTTYFSATADWSKEKYLKDLNALISEVFGSESTQFTLLIDKCDLSFLSKSSVIQDTQKNPDIHMKKLYIPTELEINNSQLDSVALEKLDGEDSRDLYEFMSILHLNALPDYSNSHVRATNMYEIPQTAIDLFSQMKISAQSASLAAVANVNPVIYYALASNPNCISVQATTDSGSILTINLPETSWTWTLRC